MTTLLISAWSVTTTAFDKHKHRNAQAYTDTPICRAEALALLNIQPAAINVVRSEKQC